MTIRRSALVLAVLAAGLGTSTAQADMTPQMKAEANAAWQAAMKAATTGPAEIKLLDQASLKLTAGEVFVPTAQANRLMTALGNPTDPKRFGLVLSQDPKKQWLVDVDWTKEGYVRDGDAKEWQPDALLQNLREGTEQANQERVARGFPAVDIIGWTQPPAYDGKTHRLVWSLSSRDRGAPANFAQTINYNTYALGREGYFSLDLITDASSIAADKTVAHDLLGSLNYIPGKRYEEFNNSTDKVAAYGLTALIGVVAVKKLGLLAMLGVFLLKVWKLGLLALAGATAAVKRFFRRAPIDPDI